MIQKFKTTSCAFTLCLFGLTLMTVSPVFAQNSAAFKQCQQIKPNGTSVPLMKQKKNCFKNLAGPRNSPAFKQCQQIKPQGAFQSMKQKKNCFRDLARNAGGAGAPAVTADSAAFVQCQQIKPNGTSVPLMKQKKNCFKNLAGPRNSPAFKQCQQIKPQGAFQPMKQKKNCFRDLARNAGGAGAPAGAPVGAPAVTAAGNTRLGNHGCGNPDRRTHVDCLRAKLDQTPLRQTVKMGPRGLGNYGCGNPDRKTHVNCLRAKLDQQGGGNVAPAVTAAGNAPQRFEKRGPGKASKRPLCNIRKGFLNKKGLKVRARECR